MLEYAYRHQIDFMDGKFECASIRELYERLAVILSRLVLDRGRRGYYREYVARRACLPYLRGRLDVLRQATVPLAATLPCRFEERTADIEDNRILAWTLRTILAGRFCDEHGTNVVRRALQELRLVATEIPYAGVACKNRIYHRLNDDYRPMHALCRFFLDLCGPTQNVGGRTMIPFMVEMPHLFEQFVAEWTRKHLSAHILPRYRVSIQETVPIGYEGNLRFDIDLVVYEAHTGVPLMVIDTKYKRPSTPSQADIFQVVTYATAKRCHDAVLVYPFPLDSPLDVQIGSIRVRSAVFPLAGDLEEGGRTFMNQLALP
jgi:5-methylcytosine-specific restriction enzyme subunit McrC